MTPPAPPALTAAEMVEKLTVVLRDLQESPQPWVLEHARRISDVLAALAAPPPDAGLVALVREWQAAMMEFGAELDASHMVSARTEKRLKDASQALLTIDTHADLC